ncbi:MAG TPA: DUF362 domain-containing protein [Terriglobales bacterium]|nr:DUF362 domain-containing protein [Terriglobales bacterium]
MDRGNSTSRRNFLKSCLAGAVVLGARGKGELLEAADQSSAGAKSTVVIARDSMLRGGASAVDSSRILSLLDRAMQSLFDLDHPAEPWKQLVHPGEKVGIKINALGGRGLSSNRHLVEAICERLEEAGVRAGDIVVWDRDTDEMGHVGFSAATAGNRVQCFGTDRIGYEEELVTSGSVGSRLSRILTQLSDVLINVPVLKDHDGAGVTGALKNMYGVIHNPNKFHPNGCNPYIADLNLLPAIRTKMRLTVCDATTACFEGGPGYKPQYSWNHNALIVSQDPVALDYTGWQIIERKRAEKGLKTLEADGRAPRYIATAADAQHRLGTSDPRRIALVEV